MLATGLIVEKMNNRFCTCTQKRNNTDNSCGNVRLTRLIDPAKGMSSVVFAGLKAVFTEVEVVAVSAFEPGAIYWEHLTAVTPAKSTGVTFEKHAGVQRDCEWLEQNY